MFLKILKPLQLVLKVFTFTLLAVLSILFIAGSFYFGYLSGYSLGFDDAVKQISEKLTQDVPQTSSFQPTPTQVVRRVTPTPKPPGPSWGGPELWEEVNKRRAELGVNPLSTRSELCTIASLRLNELLELGRLDGHEGFSNLPERRPDLKWIFEKYSISEFLVAGARSAKEAVSLWENTLGHKQLLSGGEYVWGCIYAQSGIGVAIAAY